mmetsp:Transcript_134053/g.231855  ORF Transcript_134053/g.231855 Transcript_134053/m.231855 type:complete len:247 (-) Transcript_134053:76-816(-)
MHRIALALACLAAAGHGRRVQPSALQVKGAMNPSQKLAAFLVGLNPAAGFSPSAAGVRSLAGDAMQHHSRVTEVYMGSKGGPSRATNYMQRQRPQQSLPEAPPDGTPIFFLYVRSGDGKPWYPISQFNGDATAKALIYGWTGAWFANGLFKEQLDKSMANSVFESERRMKDLSVSVYKHLSNNKPRLQFGYKPISTEIKKKVAAGKFADPGIYPVNREMIKKGWFKDAKDMMNKASNSVKETIEKR